MINDVLSLILFGICAAGVLTYSILAPWYKSLVGWSMMGLLLSMTVATGALGSLYIFGRYEYRQAIFTAVYLLLILVMASIVFNIIRQQLGRPK